MVIDNYIFLFDVEVTSDNAVYKPYSLFEYIKTIIRMFLIPPESLEVKEMVAVSNLDEFKAFKY